MLGQGGVQYQVKNQHHGYRQAQHTVKGLGKDGVPGKRICQQLKNVVSSSRLLSRAYFYSPFNDLVFQNSDALLDRKTMADRELLQAFESMEWEDSFSSAKTRTHLFHYSGRLFLFQATTRIRWSMGR